MSTTSPFIKMTLQALDENTDTWGSVLNASALELLEDAISGTATADVTSADVALNEDAGTDNAPHYRMMIIDIIGAPGSAKNVTVPPTSQVYLVVNNTTGGQTITFKTTAGSGIVIPADTASWCYCDGTDILQASASNAATADLATDSLDAQLLDGFDSTEFGLLDVANTWTAGQAMQRVTLVDSGGDITPNLAESNAFFHEMVQGENLAAPTNATNGQQFSLVVEQGVGAPWTLTFQASTFLWASGVVPTLSTVVGDIDYLAFEYVTDAAVGNRWIGSILKDAS